MANPNGTRTVRLRNPGPNTTNALAPGQSVSVTVDVTASGTCGQQPIATETKQSNDFSGSGNNFTRMGAEPTLAVSPGSFAAFAWTVQPGASQTAGVGFTPSMKVEARDACGAVVTSYQGGAGFSVSGLHNSPLPSDTPPSYGFTWLNGVATISATGYKAETTKLTVKDGTISADSSSFTVAPGSMNSLAFTTQPDEWEQRAPDSFPVAVTAVDTWGNGVPGQTITLTIDPAHNPGGATLTCIGNPSCQVSATGSVASFDVSLDKDGLGYQLQATAGTLQVNSDPFKIGDVKLCGGNNCLLNGNADGSSTSASVNGASGDLLALGFGGSIQTASGKCGGAEQIGPGFEFVVAEKGGSPTAPIWTITATLSKNTPGFDASRGAPQWEICLGTVNLGLAPYNGTDEVPCADNGDYAWPAKTGCAVWDAGTGMFWGDVPDAAPNVKKCDNQTTPVVLKKNKTGSGDLQATFCAPYPWDGGGGWR